jgi:hypothetical protein
VERFDRIARRFEETKPKKTLRHPFASLDFALRDPSTWQTELVVKEYSTAVTDWMKEIYSIKSVDGKRERRGVKQTKADRRDVQRRSGRRIESWDR